MVASQALALELFGVNARHEGWDALIRSQDTIVLLSETPVSCMYPRGLEYLLSCFSGICSLSHGEVKAALVQCMFIVGLARAVSQMRTLVIHTLNKCTDVYQVPAQNRRQNCRDVAPAASSSEVEMRLEVWSECPQRDHAPGLLRSW